MSIRPRIPLAILGGSDRKAGPMPEGVTSHPITGCKGVDIQIDGRPLIDPLIERLEAPGVFSPIYVAGPAQAYAISQNATSVIDTDGGFGTNIQNSIEGVRRLHGDGPMAIATCDVLPEPTELEEVLEDYFENAPSDLWFPLIEAPPNPEALGASEWKPKYQIRSTRGSEPTAVLPSHLTIFDPTALRLSFLYRLMDVAYETRNRPIAYRNVYFARKLLGSIFGQDFSNLLRLRPPTLTWNIAVQGSRAAIKLKDSKITSTELEDAVRLMFANRAHRKRYPKRRIRLPITNAMSLAKDIDTHEEALALGGTAVAT